MPELPEVENVKRSLQRQGIARQQIARIEFRRKDLRTPLSPQIPRLLKNAQILALHRRAKYLLFETKDHMLISHLGMSGSWRWDTSANFQPLIHDHVVVHWQAGGRLVYHDPRRFGILELAKKSQWTHARWFQHLGIEPLTEEFTADWLYQSTRHKKAPIKVFLMDQRHVVGVGNIYASEALHLAGVRPQRKAGQITKHETERLVQNVRSVLKSAIDHGGSTIRDYRNSEGHAGEFQAQLFVYGRAKQPCRTCGQPIQQVFMSARNTFWCSKCQR